MRSDQATIELIFVVGGWALYAWSVFALYIRWLYRSLFYAADKRAADVVGIATIIESLRKTRDSISSVNVTRKRFSLFPSIEQRLQKLGERAKP